MKKKKFRIWIYMLTFVISAGLPVMNLLTFDIKKIVTIVLIAFICSLIFGTIINIVWNWLSQKTES